MITIKGLRQRRGLYWCTAILLGGLAILWLCITVVPILQANTTSSSEHVGSITEAVDNDPYALFSNGCALLPFNQIGLSSWTGDSKNFQVQDGVRCAAIRLSHIEHLRLGMYPVRLEAYDIHSVNWDSLVTIGRTVLDFGFCVPQQVIYQGKGLVSITWSTPTMSVQEGPSKVGCIVSEYS